MYLVKGHSSRRMLPIDDVWRHILALAYFIYWEQQGYLHCDSPTCFASLPSLPAADEHVNGLIECRCIGVKIMAMTRLCRLKVTSRDSPLSCIALLAATLVATCSVGFISIFSVFYNALLEKYGESKEKTGMECFRQGTSHYSLRFR